MLRRLAPQPHTSCCPSLPAPAQAQIELLNSFACAAATLQHVLAMEAAGGDFSDPETQTALTGLDRQLNLLKHAFDRSSGAGSTSMLTAGGSGSGNGSGGSTDSRAPRPGDMRLSTSATSTALSGTAPQPGATGHAQGGGHSLTGAFKLSSEPLLRG
jgi:hypothetical protein